MTTLDLRRVRPALRRWSHSPRAYWLGVIVISVGTGALTWTWLHRAETLAQSWGTSRTVLVAGTDIAVGSPVDGTVTTARVLPLAALPDDAVSSVTPGAVATVRISAGSVLTPSVIDDGGGSPIARRLGGDQRAVSVPLDDVALPVSVGDRVVIYSAPQGVPAIIVAAVATVLDADGAVVTLGVPLSDTAATLEAVAAHSLQLALMGRDP